MKKLNILSVALTWIFLLFVSLGVALSQAAPLTVNTYDSQGNPIAAKYKVFKGSNYVGEFDSGNSVQLDVGEIYTVFAHYLNTSTQRETFTMPQGGKTYDFSTTSITFHFSGGYLDYRGSGSWKAFQKPTMELFPKDFYGNTMQFQFGKVWNDKRFMTVTLDYKGKTSIDKTVAVLQLLDSYGNPISGATARGGYGTNYSTWHVSGSTNADGLLMDMRDYNGSSTTFSYEMRLNNGSQVEGPQDVDSPSNQYQSYFDYETELVTLRLEDCQGTPLDDAQPRYGAGSNFGTSFWPGGKTGSSASGETEAQLFQGTYSFDMQYQGTSEQKISQTIPDGGATFTWQTTKVTLHYSGQISYGGGSGDSRWFNKPSMELLPGTYKFHFRGGAREDLTFSGCDYDKWVVVVKLLDSGGSGMEGGQARYYAGSWKWFGKTDTEGVVLRMFNNPLGNTTFQMTHFGAAVNKTQNVDVMSIVTFQTVNVTVLLEDSNNVGIPNGQARVYTDKWRWVGSTDANGEVEIELLSKSYTFQMKHFGATINQSQDVGTNPVVTFQTVNVTVRLEDSNNVGIPNGQARVYTDKWRWVGSTDASGNTSKELLPKSYTFQMKHFGAAVNKTQNVDVMSTVTFQTVNVTVRLEDSNNGGIPNGQARVYTDKWRWVGSTDASGEVEIELLSKSYTFQMKHFGAAVTQTQDIGIDPLVVFQTIKVTVHLEDGNENDLSNGQARVYTDKWRWLGATDDRGNVMMELLSKTYTFKMTYQGVHKTKSQDISSNSLVEFTYENGTLYEAEEYNSRTSAISNNLRVFPNPVRDNANVWVNIGQEGQVQLAVYDMNGQLIHILHKGQLQSDNYRFEWNTANLKAGTYILQLVNGKDVQTLPVIVINE
jgi:hypothetical protein